jgi:hypothetical protein
MVVSRKFVVCVLCEKGWQKMMGGQGRFKHAREMGVGRCWTNIKRGVQRQKEDRSVIFGLHLL